ncbi:copper chaperone CopZ [Polycladomyces subterraneus]|uniref:Copper chaperone CopZ n=1 Tax=Polycladomyces subterraneus TaxID=1016997 RepID=A0ABT8IQ58_9BACL|nr:copper chaperone CopZ [Polycladomyces subterraneus]MDN4594936.1 copper chaperone CopZ [Polycladomyces subterraneus]
MQTITLQVEGMSCDHCKQAVEGALKKLTGVERAEVNLVEKSVTVWYDENRTTVAQMKEAIEDQGYDVV